MRATREEGEECILGHPHIWAVDDVGGNGYEIKAFGVGVECCR